MKEKLIRHEYPEFDEVIRRIAVLRNGSSSNLFNHSKLYLEAESCAFTFDKISGGTKIIGYSTPGDSMVFSLSAYHFATPLVEGKGTVSELIEFLLDQGYTSKSHNYLTNNCHHIAKKAFDTFNSEGLKYKICTCCLICCTVAYKKATTFRKILAGNGQLLRRVSE